MYDSCPICHKDWDFIEKELQCCRYCNYQESYSIEMDWELIDKRLRVNEELQKRSEELNNTIEEKEQLLDSIELEVRREAEENTVKRGNEEKIKLNKPFKRISKKLENDLTILLKAIWVLIKWGLIIITFLTISAFILGSFAVPILFIIEDGWKGWRSIGMLVLCWTFCLVFVIYTIRHFKDQS